MRGAGAAAAGRRRGKESLIQEHRGPQPQLPPEQRNFTSSRDSDASYCSSRPSSIGITRSSAAAVTDLINDRSYQQSAIRTINSYLSSHSSSPSLSLKPPLPSAKDITETLRFIMSRLDYPTNKLEEDLPILLKHLNCPIKLNKSALRAPGTPHTWPSFVAVIHWLVQLAMYNDYNLSASSSTSSIFHDNSMFVYALESYVHYIQGDDDSVEVLDREFMQRLADERDSVGGNLKALEKEIGDLEAKVEALRSAPSAKEVLEKERCVLEEDVNKFHAIIGEFSGRLTAIEKVLEEKEKELETKVEENRRICEENEELKKRIELQTVNAREAERMKRELQAVERDIGEAEAARNSWEEKSWDLDSSLGHKFKELQALSIECNLAIRRLKLGNNFQYVLSAKGSTPAEVLGIDYKATLKPALNSLADDIKKSSVAKLEELISLQRLSVEIASKIEGKRNHYATLQSHLDEVEAHLTLLRKDMQDYISKCAMEAKRIIEDVEAEAYHLEIVEKEAAEMLKTSKQNLQEAIKQSDEEIQLCACEFISLVDSVSKYKEYMASKISEMKSDLAETAATVSEAYKGFLPAQVGIVFYANH